MGLTHIAPMKRTDKQAELAHLGTQPSRSRAAPARVPAQAAQQRSTACRHSSTCTQQRTWEPRLGAAAQPQLARPRDDVRPLALALDVVKPDRGAQQARWPGARLLRGGAWGWGGRLLGAQLC